MTVSKYVVTQYNFHIIYNFWRILFCYRYIVNMMLLVQFKEVKDSIEALTHEEIFQLKKCIYFVLRYNGDVIMELIGSIA